VPGALLKIYQLRDGAYCLSECDPPAYLRGTFAADERGTARVVLPDPGLDAL
jgi:hypothetical protein